MAMKTVHHMVEEAIEAFDDPSVSIASHVRRAIRIATKRQDYESLLRLYLETQDMTAGKVEHAGLGEARTNLATLVGEERAAEVQMAAAMSFMRARQKGDGKSDGLFGQSVAQLERLLAQHMEILDGYKAPPENLTQIDTYFVAKDYDAASAKIIPLRRELEDVLERVKQMVYDFLINTEREIESGQRRPSVFDRGRDYIERSLSERAPDALSKFRAAEESLASGEPEDLAHALTSCRRMIKTLADALYPASGELIIGGDGRERAMTDEAYRNRLLQYASERLGTTHNNLVKETMRSLGVRLQRLNELSSKGVHDEVEWMEAESCVMWTYLTVADILRIADGTVMRESNTSSG